MKKTVIVGFLLSLVTISTQAQSFKLWYANNVTDVADLSRIEEPGSGLVWHEVEQGTQTVAGNLVEVNKLKEMLGLSRMKTLEDKRQFWKMRDHGLLCFKVEDLDDVHHTYEVVVNNGPDSISQTVDDYFFVNAPVPHDTIAYEISVRRVDNDETVKFKYFVYEWNNENLYMFMLDQKRQVTGETYKLEYVTGYMDEDGDLHETVRQLDLQSDKFQSFYVPENSTLLDVFLMSGNDKKLRLDKSKLHAGIDLNDRMNYMEISSTFNLDKHEGREMMNFNWLGTGLYEKYDTLYLSLYNEKGKAIKNATIHPERVDYDGNRIYDPAVTYYDEELDVRNFFMRRVGKNAVISMVYMGNDSICDVYVKTIDMTGRGDGRQGNSLNVGNSLPNKVKIICDSNTENLDNFAVLWTQMGSMYRDDQGKKQISDKSFMMLNASRIYVSNALQVTDPITLGAEIDSLVITDFDGYMDDAHVSAVYTLTDITTSGSVVMYNDKSFRNSFEWDVAYGSASLMGSNTLPVIFTISNTGTSAIERITEPIQAYVNCHLVDMNYAEQGLESMLAAVKNVRALENPTLVNLFPGEDPATFVRPAISEEPTGHKVTINTQDNGVRLDGLTTGNNVRVFTSNGIVMHKKEATGSTMFA